MKNRVYLRALEIDDYKTTINWRNDDEIWEMVGGPKYFVSKDYEEKWISEAIKNQQEVRLGVSLKANNLLIGLISITNVDMINRSGEISFMIGNKDYWSMGYGAEAVNLILDYSFNERGMERIWCVILESNVASLRMVTKCGFRKEAILRSAVFKNGVFQNQIIKSILREEYFNK